MAAARRSFVRRFASIPALAVLLSAGLLVDVASAAAPAITSFSPQSGPFGTPVTIRGNNFMGTEDVQFFPNKSATFTVHSNTRITTTVPDQAQTGPIKVIKAEGTATSPSDFVVTATAAPSIDSFSPTSGPMGSAVTVNGTNFDGATSVKFNGVSTTFSVKSSLKITTTVPSGATTGPISVTTGNGTATSRTAFTVPGTPTVGGFSPSSGPFDSRVVITGQSYSNVSAVKFNGVSASFTINSATQVTAIVPRGATTGPISVTNPNGTAFGDDPFTIKHLRRVTLSLSGSLRASGMVMVLDGTAACTDEVAVRIQRFVSGSWRTVGTTVTDEDASYSVRVANREGRHRARTPRFTLDNGDVCARATSPAVSNV